MHPLGFIKVRLLVKLAHHKQFLTAWESTADNWCNYVYNTGLLGKKSCQQDDPLFLVKYLLQSTFITAASPQFDLHFLPILIRYKKTNKQNASAASSSLPVSNSYSNQIFAIGIKPCISYILYCTFMPLKNTQYYTRILLHDICLLLPNVSP